MKNQLKEYKFNMKFYYEVPETIDFERFNKKGNLKRKKLGLKEEDYVTLMMGYDIKIKGVDIAIEAFKMINKKNYKLIIVMARNKEKNIKEIKSNNNGKIPENVIILGPTENINDYYYISNQFLSASRTEGFSNAILEALYLKKKVIISDIEGVSWAKQYPSVLTYNVNDTNRLKKCITEKINLNEEELTKIQEDIKNKYNIDTWSKEVINLYKNIIKGE